MAKTMYPDNYGKGAVYGSLAYDFNYPGLYPEFEYGARPEAPSAPKTAEKAQPKVKTRTAARTKQSIAPAALMGYLIAAVLLVACVMSQVQLAQVSDSSVTLQSKLTELETQQAKLKIAYESAFNLTEIEEYAIATLGMQKSNADQVYYIDTSSPDKAVVVKASSDGFVDRVSDAISGLFAYLN